jgi:hypothetical protein
MVQTIQSDAAIFPALLDFLKRQKQHALLEHIEKRIVPPPLFT